MRRKDWQLAVVRLRAILLTSRETHGWVNPKGWPMKRRKHTEMASQEAYEEAGLIGHIVDKRPWRFSAGRSSSDLVCKTLERGSGVGGSDDRHGWTRSRPIPVENTPHIRTILRSINT
jgi:hypothetical protein